MTLLHVESFESLAYLADRYTGYSMDSSYCEISTAKYRSGSKSLLISHNDRYVNIAFASANEVYVGVAILFTSVGAGYLAAAGTIGSILGNGGGANLTIGQDVYGSIILKDATGGFLYKTPHLCFNAWHFIEIKLVVSNSSSSGDCILKINNEQLYSCGTSIDFYHSSNTTAESEVFKLGPNPTGFGPAIYYDDIYVCDSAGSVNNTFLGDSSIETLKPNGNGNANNFTGSDADSTDNYLHVDDQTPDDDSTYVEDDTASNVDLYAFEDSAFTPGTIHGVQASVYAKKDDAGSRTGRILCRRSSVNYEGDTFNPGTDYLYFDKIWETDPSTASAWVQSNLNAAEFGIKVQA